ncbi:MAG: putative metal-binding motif-containing protein [Deltaproteobacteria bacterium]|nr:putative metal-binding motif-containing protein [Deltaproteobacteria bacterium]
MEYARPQGMKGHRPARGSGLLAAIGAIALGGYAMVACAHSSGTDGIDGGGGDAATIDASVPDAAPDASLCIGVTCTGLNYCDNGVCTPFPTCADGDAGPPCRAGETCRNGVCIPDADDPDGDGSPATIDCDETDPQIHPGAPERCNGKDDNCDGNTDEGDPIALCSNDPSGDICSNGSCGCLPGNYDLDPTVPGCECVASPLSDQGTSCGAAIELGSLSDVGQSAVVAGNIVPAERQVWYHFTAVDLPDTTCDNFHVRAQLTANPGDQFRVQVARGSCGNINAGDYTDYTWATDLRQTINGGLTGECPCWSGTPVDNVSPCTDDGGDYYVVVTRTAGSTLTCESFALEVSNGLYDWQ